MTARQSLLKEQITEREKAAREEKKRKKEAARREESRLALEKRAKNLGGPSHRERWEERFRQLAEYREAFGNCDVPIRYAPNVQLGRWVQKQRMLYRKRREGLEAQAEAIAAAGGDAGAVTAAAARMEQQAGMEGAAAAGTGGGLEDVDVDVVGVEAGGEGEDEKGIPGVSEKVLNEERIGRLESMGFRWWAQTYESTPWETRFEELLAFKALNGHCRVPKNYADNPGLSEWVKTQRRNYKEKAKVIQGERMEKLLESGFEFVVAPSVKSWEARYDQLLVFRRNHGHCEVPAVGDASESGIITGTDADDERAFRRWAHRQRTEYWKHRDGQRSCLDRNKIKKLDALNFRWGRSA